MGGYLFFMRMMTIVFVTVIEETIPISIKMRRIMMCSLVISITSLSGNFIPPLSRRLTAYGFSVA